MEFLIEDYKRRLAAIEAAIDYKFKHKGPDNPDFVRYTTKASCYRTFIAELEREINFILKH